MKLTPLFLSALVLAGCGHLNEAEVTQSSPGSTLRATTGDSVLTLELGRATDNGDGSQTWTGHVVGEPFSSAVVVRYGNLVRGTVKSALGSYEVVSAEDGLQLRLQEATRRGQCGAGSPSEPGAPMAVISGQAPVVAKGPARSAATSTIDLYAVYNAPVLQRLGSATAVQAKLQELVGYTNEAWENSGIDVRLNLLGSEEVTYTQASGTSVKAADRDALADFANTVFAERRAALGADLMTVLLSIDPPQTGTFTAGIADLPSRTNSGLTRALGFSAISVEGGLDILAHELGHNFGCQHDTASPSAPPSQALYPFAFGQRLPGQWATVMAYPQGGELALPVYSTPLVTFRDVPVGVKDVTENARAIALSAPQIAGYLNPAPTPAPGGPTISLASGWNGVAFQTQRVTSVSSNPSVAGVATFDGAGYATGNADPATINAGEGTRRGFFLFATAPTTLVYSGQDDGQGNFVNLRSGWNLCAFVGSAEVPGSALRALVAGEPRSLGSVVLPQFSEIQPGGGYATVDVAAGGRLTPGRAYWVFSLGSVRLTW